MSEIYDNWERLVAAVLRKEELWELFHAPSRSPSISSESETSSNYSSSPISFRLEIEQLQSSDFISSAFESCLQIEELQSSDFSPRFGSCLEIEELTPDEHTVRSSDSRDAETTREIIPVPCGRENRITRTATFQENKMTFFCFPLFRGIFQRKNAVITVGIGRKVVLKVNIVDERSKQKAMKRVCSSAGVESLTFDMKGKKLTVVGDVDPMALLSSLRKLWHADLMSVGPAKEPMRKKVAPKTMSPDLSSI